MHILLIEDDLSLGSALLEALKLEGFSVQWLRRAGDAPHRLGDAGCAAAGNLRCYAGRGVDRRGLEASA